MRFPSWSRSFVNDAVTRLPQLCDELEFNDDLEMNDDLDDFQQCVEWIFDHPGKRSAFEQTVETLRHFTTTDPLYRFLIVDDVTTFVHQLKTRGKTQHHDTHEWVGLGEAWSTDRDFDIETLVTETPTENNAVIVEAHQPAAINVEETLYRSLFWAADRQAEITLRNGSKIHVDRVCKYFDPTICFPIDRNIEI